MPLYEMPLMPMATAPRTNSGDKLLVVDEFMDYGQVCRAWSLVYWLDAFDGNPAGWYGKNSGGYS